MELGFNGRRGCSISHGIPRGDAIAALFQRLSEKAVLDAEWLHKGNPGQALIARGADPSLEQTVAFTHQQLGSSAGSSEGRRRSGLSVSPCAEQPRHAKLPPGAQPEHPTVVRPGRRASPVRSAGWRPEPPPGARFNVFPTAEHDGVLGTTGQRHEPSGSSNPRSPVSNQPSASSTLAVASGLPRYPAITWGPRTRTLPRSRQSQSDARFGIHDPKLRLRHRQTGTSADVAPWTAAAHHRTGLGESIAHQQLNPHRLEEGIDVRSDRTRPADRIQQLATAQLASAASARSRLKPAHAQASAGWLPARRQPIRCRHRLQQQSTGSSQRPALRSAVGQGRAQQALTRGRKRLQHVLKPACTASHRRGTVAIAIGRTRGRSFLSCLIVV